MSKNDFLKKVLEKSEKICVVTTMVTKLLQNVQKMRKNIYNFSSILIHCGNKWQSKSRKISHHNLITIQHHNGCIVFL
jgi:predicted DNA-binding ribbon-helix-helix protein